MADPEGEALGTRPPPLLLDQTEARRTEKFFFRPPRPPLSEGLDLPLISIVETNCAIHWTSIFALSNFEQPDPRMDSLLFDPALVGRLKQFLISIAIHLKSAKKRSCLIFTLITSFMLKNSTPFYHLMISVQPEAANKIP